MTERIIIIGGGYTGTISAALLSKLKSSTGKPLYEVILLEEKEHILDGASKIIDRLHLGGEYPLDDDTGIECLNGAILFKQMLPDIYTKNSTTSYVVSAKTQQSGNLTVEKVIQQYQKIQQKYREYFAQLSSKFGNEKAENILFGNPEELFSILSDMPPVVGFVGGIKTKEKGVNPVLLGAFLETLIQKQGIKIYTNHKVINAEYAKDRFKIDVSQKDGNKISFYADQVINAAWHNALFLNTLINKQEENIHAYLRCTAITDISACREKPEAIFGMLGENGGSYSPMNNKIAFLYLPQHEGSYLGETEQNLNNPLIPDLWEKVMENGPTDITKRKKFILKKLKERYPFLKGAKILKLIARPTLASNNIISERRHAKVYSIDSNTNWLCAISMKATFAPMVAIEVLQKVQRNSLLKGLIHKEELVYSHNEFSIVLPQQLILSDESFGTLEFFKYAKNFALTRDLPSQIIEINENITIPLHKSSKYTEPLRFVLIHTGDNVEKGISFFGTHMHAVKESLVSAPRSLSYKNHNLPPNTIVQHGTVDDLYKGNFDTTITEHIRKIKIGGDAGIASRAIPRGNKLVLNDEAIVIENQGFYGDFHGKGQCLENFDTYSFLQVFTLKGAEKLYLPSANNIDTIIKFIQKKMLHTKSFAACFTAVMLKNSIVSRVIKSPTEIAKTYDATVQEIWNEKKEVLGHYQPDVSHVVDCKNTATNEYYNNIIITSPIETIPIKQFLVSDKMGDIELSNGRYRKITT